MKRRRPLAGTWPRCSTSSRRRGYPPGAIDAVFGPMTGHGTAELPARARPDRRWARQGRPRSPGCGAGRHRGGPHPWRRAGAAPVGPWRGRIGDGFGAAREGRRTHTGIDFPVSTARASGAAGVGVTEFAGCEHGRLRQPRRGPPPARLHHLVRAPLLGHHLGGRAGDGRHAARLRRHDRALHRPAPALRAAQERRAGRPECRLCSETVAAARRAPAAALPPRPARSASRWSGTGAPSWTPAARRT